MTALAVLLCPTSGRRETLGRSSTTLGRSESNDVVVTGNGISRFHAVVDSTKTGHVIRDLGSRNGTFVNGVEISADGRRLDDADLIVLAGSVSFRYLDPQATPIVPRLGRTTGVWIDEASADVWVDAKLVEPALSPRQHALLVLLLEADGGPVSKQQVVAAIWSDVESVGVSDDAISALVKRLRARLREVSGGTDYVEVLRGRGFRLVQ